MGAAGFAGEAREGSSSRTAIFTEDLKRMLASPNICGKRWVWQQYDSMVQTNTVDGPGAADAGVIRIKGSQRGLAMALDGNGRWCYLDPRLGAMHAVAEAARNVACAGATPVGATNCLNFGNPEKPHIMWQFSQVIDGITKACDELQIPITGGNVSFYNETLGRRNLSHAGDGSGRAFSRTCTKPRSFRISASPGVQSFCCRAKPAGRLTDAESEFGSSEYAKEVLGSSGDIRRNWTWSGGRAAKGRGGDDQWRAARIRARLCGRRPGGRAGRVSVPERQWGSVNIASQSFLPSFVLFGEDASRVSDLLRPRPASGIQQLAE